MKNCPQTSRAKRTYKPTQATFRNNQMNKREAFKQTKAIYPNLKPTRASGFALTQNKQGIIITGYDENVAVILHNTTDIYKLMDICQLTTERKKKSDPKRSKNKPTEEVTQ